MKELMCHSNYKTFETKVCVFVCGQCFIFSNLKMNKENTKSKATQNKTKQNQMRVSNERKHLQQQKRITNGENKRFINKMCVRFVWFIRFFFCFCFQISKVV